MRSYSLVASSFCAAIAAVYFQSACGASKGGGGFGNPGGSSASGSGGGSGGSGSGGGSGGSGSSGGSGFGTSSTGSGGGPVGDGGVACPSGLQCNVSCAGNGTTSVSGKVYDPAGKNPLYNIVVYVPATPLQALTPGVPTGNDSCSCYALFKSGALTSTTTGVDGSFTLTNVPVGSNVPLVLQIGKWRRSLQINVASCQDNPQPDKSLTLPGTVMSGSDDNLPDIAVSTGAADTLECLMTRIGLPPSEYVAGAGGSGHIHVFSGGNPASGGGTGAVGMIESPGWSTMAPASSTNLWDTQAHLMPYDILLLSCEGGETYQANPTVLEQYLNAGGRAFSSHFHYAWFAGPIQTGQMYSAPMDWGTNLATWTGGAGDDGAQANGIIEQTLNGSTMPFPKGVAFAQWLAGVNALGVLGAPAMELPMMPPKLNAMVGPANKPSQPWVHDDMHGNAMYFSFDTPVNLNPPPTGPDPGGGPSYCGRAVYSDLHVGKGQATPDAPPNCTQADLSPQEKALEFMLFDLSACVIPDTIAPPVTVPNPPQ
jgi:hypothetical protein